MIPALTKFIFPTSSNQSPSKMEDGSEQLKVITEPNLHDDSESVQSSATLNTSSYSSMKKDDLVALASRAGIRLDKKATKAQIIKLLATTSLGINQPTSVSGDQEVDADSVASATPFRTRGRLTTSSRTSELPDASVITSPLRTRSSASKTATQVNTPATAKSLRIKHELRSPKELRMSHQKALDPQFEYYSAVETIDVNVRMTRSAKKAKSGSRTTPIKRKRSSSISERSASKSTTHASADESSETEQPSVQTRRTSRRTKVSQTQTPSSTVKAATQRRKSSIEPATKNSVVDRQPASGAKRRQSSDLPVSKRPKKASPIPAPIEKESEEESADENSEHMNDDQQGSFEMLENNIHSISGAEESHQMEQDILDSLKDTHDQSDSEEDSNNSDDEVDIESAEDDQEVDHDDDDGEADQDMMVDDEDDDDDDNENSEEDDEDESSNDSEESESDSNDGEEDDSDDFEEGEEEEEEGDNDYIAPVTYNVPPNSFMAAFLAAGKKTADAMTNEVMDLVSDHDQDENVEKDNKQEKVELAKAAPEKPTVSNSSFAPTTIPKFPAFTFAPMGAAATVKTSSEGSEAKNVVSIKENPKPVVSIKENPKPVHPALEAFNKLGSKLITAAVAAESTETVSDVEKLSAQEYDLIKSILSKIKPPEVVEKNEDEVNLGQKRALSKDIDEVTDDSGLDGSQRQESAMKRRRTSTDSRVSYDGGESWNLSHPSGEDPLSPSYNTYPTPRSSMGGVFGRSSFGGGLFGRVQTPYHHNYRASIGSNNGDASAAVSASKAMFDRRIEEAATSLPPMPAVTDLPVASKKSGGVTFNLGSTTTNGNNSNSASKVFGSGGRSSYTPQFRSSAASFVPAATSSGASRDSSLSLLSAEESSMSYLEKRRQQRQMQASASATVAKQILDTLGSLSSPIDKQPAPIGLLTQEADVLKFGSTNVPDFQSKLNQSSSGAVENGSSKPVSEKPKPSVSFASTVTSSSGNSSSTSSAPKVSFALSTKDDDDSSAKSSKFFAPPTPMPLSSSSGSDKHVKFATETASMPSVSLMTPASKSSSAGTFSNNQSNNDSFNLADDDDQVIVVEKKRSSIGSTPFKPSFSSSSMDADEFSFDEPMVVKGVDNDFVGRENIADIRYAFTPPSKPKRSRLATPAANKVNNKPIVDSLKKDAVSSSSSSAAVETSSTTPNIWNLKPNPNEKKCQVCLVMNDKAATKCESCGSAFPATASAPSAAPTPAPVTNIWNMKPNPNEKKCQVCLVMNDKKATKCESCGSSFPDSAAASTSSAPSSSAAVPAAFSSSSAAPKTAASAPTTTGGFTFGVVPAASTTAAPVPTPATSFSFGVPKPASTEESEADKAAPAAAAAVPKLDSKAAFSGFSFGVTSAPPPAAAAADVGTTLVKASEDKKETSTAAPAISFGMPKTDNLKSDSSTSFTPSTAAKPSAFTGGFSFGAPSNATLPTIPENKPLSQKEEQDDEQPTRKRRVEEDEPAKVNSAAPFKAAPSISFGVPSSSTPSTASTAGMFGLPAPASSSSSASLSTSATEDKKKDDAAVSKPFSGSFTFGAPAATAAAPTTDAAAKPLFGAPAAAPVVTTTALPSFAGFGKQQSSSTAATATTAPVFGVSSSAPLPPTAALPPLGTASSAPFNAFAPSASASTAAAAAPSASSSSTAAPSSASTLPVFGATTTPAAGSGPFGAFAATPAADSKPSNPFGSFGSTNTPAVPVGSAPAPTPAPTSANPFASAFNTSASVPVSAATPATTSATFPPATSSSNPFGVSTAVKQPFGTTPAAPAPSSNPFAASFAAPPSAAPLAPAVIPAGPFGGASVAPSAPTANPFTSSFGSSNNSGSGSGSNPFASSFSSAPAPASLTPSSSTNNFAFGGAGIGAGGMGVSGMGGFPAAPSLTPQTSFSAPANNFPSQQPMNNMFGGVPSGVSLPPNPMMPSGGGGGFSLGAGGAPGGGAAGGGGQQRKILKIKKKV